MQRVQLFGILNATPDSFSDGGLYFSTEKAMAHAAEMFSQGAAFVDVGAESTRPHAPTITPEEEQARLAGFFPDLVHGYRGHISLDTRNPETVRWAASLAGNFIINDVTSFNNPEMIKAAAELGLPCIVSHLPAYTGTDIQAAHNADRKVHSVDQVLEELLTRRDEMIAAGIPAKSITLDPGIGFGKSQALNYELLTFAEHVEGIDVMIGYSRKSFLGEHRLDLEINLTAGRIAIASGARYLRVHDVAEHYDGLGLR